MTAPSHHAEPGEGNAAAFAAVVVPTFNHAPALGEVLDGLAALRLPVIVVDDGSTDGTPAVLDAWHEASADFQLIRLHHPRNRGKAAALRTGFDAAAALPGVTHAVTIDSDGQLDPADIPLLLSQGQRNPDALILGTRPPQMPGCPRRCAVGRRLAGLAVLAQTGQRLADTQCGLRLYPLALVRSARTRSGRYAYEAEVITRALWEGRAVVEVPVRCTYHAGGRRVSHFRPFGDSLRQAVLHARLIATALLRRVHTRPSGTSTRCAGSSTPGV